MSLRKISAWHKHCVQAEILPRLSKQTKLIGELRSAFGASSFQHFSAVCSSHSFSEAVLLASLALFGLVRSFHVGNLL